MTPLAGGSAGDGAGDPKMRQRRLLADFCRLVGSHIDGAEGKLPVSVAASFPTDPPKPAEGGDLSPRLQQTLGRLLAGDSETGITIMRMDAGLDTGPMLLREAVPITATTTTAVLHDTLAILGARLILSALTNPSEPVPQPADGATYAPKLTRDDGRIDTLGELSKTAGAVN